MTTAKDILRENICRLARKSGMWSHARDEPNQSALSRATHGKLNQTTVGYIVKDSDVSPRLESIEALAAVFGLSSWQMLVPNLDPFSPPVLHNSPHARVLTPEQSRLVTMFSEVKESDQRQVLNLLAETWATMQLSKRGHSE